MEDKLVPYQEKERSKIYLFIIAAFALLIGWYFWAKIRPQLIYANCEEIAYKSTQSLGRSTFTNESDQNEYDKFLDACLEDFHITRE